ncbi:WEB family protein At3g51220-like [Phoenix dactylifera]|uniref:WEB family protein At3g51220-like n=1 Tax=Phoenix dactylifera TaxID=42345 RepID=A0A8B7BTR6_PHODC|nr:WEB family protein At3g51220-like [Phoenix dactylifera]XP_038977505.1 WEB family protein At3g51220-like [Phoenix dactylifera]
METEGSVAVAGRAEIDTSKPFQSVKEAVVLFGERVLAGEVYANRLNEIRAAASRNVHGASQLGSIMAELEETKQNLEQARQESLKMASCLTYLREELEQTKMELKQLQARESEKNVIDSEADEDLKFVENATEIEIETPMMNEGWEFQKKRYVTFANPPSLAQVINTEEQALEGQVSVEKETVPMKKKKKPLIPLIRAFFAKKRSYEEGSSPKVRGP